MKLIIDIDDKDYELINKTGVTLDLNTVVHGKEKDKEMTFAIFDLVKALKNGTPYEERPQGEWIENVFLGGFVCSNCNGGYNTLPKTKYCPLCGADMRGGEES